MRERKPYPNISDEELDRRAEEALKRMLAANPQRLPGAPAPNHGQNPGQNHGQKSGRRRQRNKQR